MSNPDPKKPAADDPLVISTVTFQTTATIGGHGTEEWSLAGARQNQYHGKSRCEPFSGGIRVVYKAGLHYEETEVPWSNIRSVTRVPLSRLDPKVREVYERTQQEVRR